MIKSNVVSIQVIDDREYKPGLDRNGGHYSFSVHYDRLNDNEWRVSYYSSAEFQYCSRCGLFHSECDKSHSTITTRELLLIISLIWNDPKCYFVAHYSDRPNERYNEQYGNVSELLEEVLEK